MLYSIHGTIPKVEKGLKEFLLGYNTDNKVLCGVN
jgi:hypothetical protein